MWDVTSGTIIRRLQGHFGKVFTVAFNKDAQILASGEPLRMTRGEVTHVKLALTLNSCFGI